MKNFLLGVLAAALAAILAYVGQSYYDSYRDANNQSLEYTEYTPSLILTKETTSNWFNQVEGGQSETQFSGVKITLVEIENTGSQSITDQIVRIGPTSQEFVGNGVIGFQNHMVPGGDQAGTRLEIRDKSLGIRYSLFNPGDSHVFWVFSDRFTDLNFIARRPGLTVQRWDVGVSSWNSPDEDYSWRYAVYFVIALVFFIIGLVVLDITITKALSKRGYDLKKIMAEKPSESEENG